MLADVFPPQKPDFRLLFCLSRASGARDTSPTLRSSYTNPGAGDASAESCTLPVSWQSQLFWGHPVQQEQQASCCTYKWTVVDSYHWQKKKRWRVLWCSSTGFFSSLNGCSFCVCWQKNHSVQRKRQQHHSPGSCSPQCLQHGKAASPARAEEMVKPLKLLLGLVERYI